MQPLAGDTRGSTPAFSEPSEGEVKILDQVEVWVNSVRGILEPVGIVIQFERTHDQRLKPSCTLNIRKRLVEVDLIVWESGEADLNFQQSDGRVNQEHFDDLLDPQALSVVLERVMTIIRPANP